MRRLAHRDSVAITPVYCHIYAGVGGGATVVVYSACSGADSRVAQYPKRPLATDE